MNLDRLAPEYLSLWRTMEVREEWRKRVADAAKKIVAGRARYAEVETATGVPWWVVGIIHHLEAGCDFGRHLHNGDPLTARTVQVPRGRPTKGKPPFRWEESAVDALVLDKLDQVEQWDVANLAAALEAYNGWGYRLRAQIVSPYLWSGTNHYMRGKFTSDGKFSAAAVSQQPGAMAIAAELARIDRTIDLVAGDSDPAAEHQRTPSPGPASMAGSTEAHAAATVGAGGTWQTSTEVSGAFAKVAASGKPFAVGDLLLHLAASPTFWIGLSAIAGGLYWWLRRASRLKRFGV